MTPQNQSLMKSYQCIHENRQKRIIVLKARDGRISPFIRMCNECRDWYDSSYTYEIISEEFTN